MHTSRRGLPLLLAAVLMLAACGGDSTETSLDEADSDELIDEALDQFGIDVDDGEGDSEDGTGDAAESETVDPATSSDDSGATVQVGDLVLAVDKESCFYDSGFFQFDGIATNDTDSPFVSISGGTEEDYDDDGTNDVEGTVSIDYGWKGSSEEPRADLQADTVEFSSPDSPSFSMFEFTIDGNVMAGSGEIEDVYGVLIPLGERADLTFTATC